MLQQRYSGARVDLSDKLKVAGYVFDNMEGALDQAAFLARVDIPIAVIGARGTGKFYVASTVHREFAGESGSMIAIDCREFRNREEASQRIRRALAEAGGNTVVFKSPHLMNNQAQQRLARQLSTRRLEGDKPVSVPAGKFIGLFPDRLEKLVRSGELTGDLASAFGGFPIEVPPIRSRKRAILRWAYKILGQEAEDRGREVKGFSDDAERAMLQHEWHGNLTEMRQRIVSALVRSDREWIGPVELDLIQGNTRQTDSPSGLDSYLDNLYRDEALEENYSPSAEDELNLAIARAVHDCLSEENPVPLGTWLWDEVVLQVIDRYRGELPRAGEFMQTSSRNLSRWLPKIEERADERAACDLWREAQRLVLPWIREMPVPEAPLKDTVAGLVLPHLENLGAAFPAATRAAVMGVSVPTYNKQLKITERPARGGEDE